AGAFPILRGTHEWIGAECFSASRGLPVADGTAPSQPRQPPAVALHEALHCALVPASLCLSPLSSDALGATFFTPCSTLSVHGTKSVGRRTLRVKQPPAEAGGGSESGQRSVVVGDPTHTQVRPRPHARQSESLSQQNHQRYSGDSEHALPSALALLSRR